MVKITHPSMRRGRDNSTQNVPPQTYVVDDASNHNAYVPPEVDDLDEKLKQFESTTRVGPPAQVSPTTVTSAKASTLESLIFAGKIEKEIELAGTKYRVSTLTNKEYNEIVKELYSFGQAADLFVIKSLTLAYVLKSINGVSLGDISIDGQFASELFRRKEIVDNLQMTVVDKLYEYYNTILSESEKLVQGEELKKS